MSRDKCRDIIKNLHRILDEGNQSDDLCQEIQVHLSGCSACAGQYRELETLKSLCRNFPDSSMSEEQKKMMKKDLKKALLRKGSG